MSDVIEKYVKDVDWIREKLLRMDDMIRPIMGIGAWDDAACVEFNGRLVASTDGPYAKRLVMRSALIHAAGDVVVKGAKPMFALDNLIGSRADVGEMLDSLGRQAEYMRIPILGGNTFIDEESEPLSCVTVIGKLVTDEPIRDSGAKKDDAIVLIGEPIWGKQEERLPKAKTLFDTMLEAVEKIKFTSAKDVTKGGLTAVVYEMEKKSGRRFKINDDIPYHRTRNLDNFIVTLNEYEYVTLAQICSQHKCKLTRIGTVGLKIQQ